MRSILAGLRSLVLPWGARQTDQRIVIGADTPAELLAYGIDRALIFYVNGVEEGGLQTGYFFIGLSNQLDVGNDEAVLFGSVRYPVLGDPGSPTMADVKTHFQMSWDFSGTGATGFAYTVFKDKSVIFNSTVTDIVSHAINHFWNGDWFIVRSAVKTSLESPQTDVTGLVNFSNSIMRPVNDIDTIGFSINNTVASPTASTTGTQAVVGVTFVAPPSGAVWVSVSGWIQSDQNTNGLILGWEMRQGAIIGSGTIQVGADYRRGITSSTAVNTGAPTTASATRRKRISGLTPGNSYNVQTMHWMSPAGGGTIAAREIDVEPIA